MKIETINIEDIKPYKNNAKLHPPEQIEQIKKSIVEFGNNDPIAIDENNIIIEGHGRYMALKELGYKEAQCIRLNHLNDEQKRAYMLAHNKLTMNTDFDFEMLEEEINSIINFDMSDFGFDDININNDITAEIIEDEVPDPPKEAKAKLGDIYQLGKHRLMCGDSTKFADVEKLMNGYKADMVFTDPPYNCNYGHIEHPKFKSRKIKNDYMPTEKFRDFCTDFISNIKEFATGCVYICAGQSIDGRIMFTVADNIIHNSTTIIWNKDHFTLGQGKYQNKYESIWFGWVVNGSDFTNDRTLTNVWDIPRPKKSELHPTMKPIAVVSTALEHNPKSKSCLDLFGGSGSTIIACEQLGRICYMMELDPKYIDVIIDRWEKFTGNKAVKIN